MESVSWDPAPVLLCFFALKETAQRQRIDPIEAFVHPFAAQTDEEAVDRRDKDGTPFDALEVEKAEEGEG